MHCDYDCNSLILVTINENSIIIIVQPALGFLKLNAFDFGLDKVAWVYIQAHVVGVVPRRGDLSAKSRATEKFPRR